MQRRALLGIIIIIVIFLIGNWGYKQFTRREIPVKIKQQAGGQYSISGITIFSGQEKSTTPFLQFTTALQHEYIGENIDLIIKPLKHVRLSSRFSKKGGYMEIFQDKILKYKGSQNRNTTPQEFNMSQHITVEDVEGTYYETDTYELIYNDMSYKLLLKWERISPFQQPTEPSATLFITYKDCYYQGMVYKTVIHNIQLTKE